MTDRDAILETISLYALAVDTQRWDLFDRVFTPDADVDFGSKKTIELGHRSIVHTTAGNSPVFSC